jgi:hypothetical protein
LNARLPAPNVFRALKALAADTAARATCHLLCAGLLLRPACPGPPARNCSRLLGARAAAGCGARADPPGRQPPSPLELKALLGPLRRAERGLIGGLLLLLLLPVGLGAPAGVCGPHWGDPATDRGEPTSTGDHAWGGEEE